LKDEVTRNKEEQSQKQQDAVTKLNMFNSMYGDFSDRNPVTKEDPNIGKTLEIKNAK
jgi:hypothetical protein